MEKSVSVYIDESGDLGWKFDALPTIFCISVRKEQVELYARQDVHLLYSYMTKRMLLKYD